MDKHAEAIKAAEATHTEMVGRLLSARASLAEGATRRRELALAVETGDVDARRETAASVKAAAVLREDIERLSTAVDQAAQNVTRARAAAEAERKREAAQKAREVLERMTTGGAEMDAGLRQALATYQAFKSDLADLAALGAPTPGRLARDVRTRNALNTALFGFHSEIRPLPKKLQQSFESLCREWTIPSERWASQILDAPEKQKDAA
jgi:hypothetical protein